MEELHHTLGDGAGKALEVPTEPVPFEQLVGGFPRWEICRRFLTCLALTNSGYTDILVDSEANRLNSFSVQIARAGASAALAAAGAVDPTEAAPLGNGVEASGDLEPGAPAALPGPDA